MLNNSPEVTSTAVDNPSLASPATRLVVTDEAVILDVSLRGDGPPPVTRIRLGVQVDGADLAPGASLLRTRERAASGTWTARTGKASGLRSYRHRELVHELRTTGGQLWQIHVREAQDGVAVRYALPELQGHAALQADLTAFSLDDFDRAWPLEYQTWYETPRRGVDLPLPDATSGLPLLLRRSSGSDYALVTEAAIDGRHSGAHLELDPDTARFVLADSAVEITRGVITPWRVFVLGALEQIVETHLVDELAPEPPREYADADWVRPGRAVWSWWSDFYSGAQLDQQKQFVDGAAALGWEHLLIDCGWDPAWIPDIVEYASRRGIQVHLWAVWHDLDGPENLSRLALWRSWGVAGIKIDFMESESKDRYRWYDTILAESARLCLMVNFHGSVIPRGWARTWPQVIAYEAIRGAEYYVFYQDAPLTAEHNVIQPFTRNVIGAMDYTPVAFTAPGRQTSDAHELALAVVYESGITHFAEDPEIYRARPAAARLLAELPPVWDETLLLAGSPDTEAIIARRSADRWFIGGIATGGSRSLTVPLCRLGAGPWHAWIVDDEETGGLKAAETTPNEVLNVTLADDGGFAAILARQGSTLFRAEERPVQPPVDVQPHIKMLEAGCAQLQLPVDTTPRPEPGWRVRELGEGRWRIEAPPSLRPGEIGVLTVERATSQVPVLSHVRLVQPLGEDVYRLSALGMTGFENESGPVERDQSNGGGNPGDGQRMRIAETEHDDGFGVSTPSRLSFYIGGRADRMDVQVGVDDESPGTSAIARVLGDGAVLAETKVVSGRPAQVVTAGLRDITELVLTTEPDGADLPPAHVDWASARVTGAPVYSRSESIGKRKEEHDG